MFSAIRMKKNKFFTINGLQKASPFRMRLFCFNDSSKFNTRTCLSGFSSSSFPTLPLSLCLLLYLSVHLFRLFSPASFTTHFFAIPSLFPFLFHVLLPPSSTFLSPILLTPRSFLHLSLPFPSLPPSVHHLSLFCTSHLFPYPYSHPVPFSSSIPLISPFASSNTSPPSTSSPSSALF